MEAAPRWPFVEGPLRRFTKPFGLNDVHRVSSFRIPYNVTVRSADVLHFHGTHSGFFNYLALPIVSQRKPIVLTVRDMWPLTGHCAFNYDCDRWRFGCGQCPYPEATPRIERDATHIEWKLKNWVYEHSNLTVVAVSSCYANRAKEGLLSRFPVHTIRNGLDTGIFKPSDPRLARKTIEIDENSWLLMSVATRLTRWEKGADLLLAALNHLPRHIQDQTVLLLVGGGADELAARSPIPTRALEFVDDPARLAQVYSAADLVVVPSRSEPLSNVAQESLACGTPVVAFGVDGLTDVVRPGRTGQLAIPGDPVDLARSVTNLLQDASLRKWMGKAGRQFAESEFTTTVETSRYLELYNSVISARE